VKASQKMKSRMIFKGRKARENARMTKTFATWSVT
jgi:hypothetical protein